MKILGASEIKKWDLFTIKKQAISSLDLMERAAANCSERIMKDFSNESYFHIISNKGNNGADGLVIARKLIQNNYKVRVSVIEFSDNESSEFKTNFKRLDSQFISHIFSEKKLVIKKGEIIVDAIFGCGLNKEVKGKFSKLINYINQSHSKIISIDMPSGLFPDENRKNNGSIIQSDTTYTFQCMKFSLLLPSYSKYYGNVKIIDIGLDKRFLKTIKMDKIFLTNESVPKLKKRLKFSHKGDFGHALLIGGNKTMQGAILLSSKSVLRSGVGKLSVSLPKDYIRELNISLPESIIFQESKSITEYTAVGIGPGLGTDLSAKKKVESFLLQRGNLPLVLDADALNIISKNFDLLKLCENSIITPHIGEFKRLCGDLNSDEERLEKQQRFSIKHKLIIILKGAHTSISTPDGKVFFNSTGNPGMATAGSGDVLCGIVLSLLAQGYQSTDAACLAVYLHGKAADFALERQSVESLIASDIIYNLGLAFDSLK